MKSSSGARGMKSGVKSGVKSEMKSGMKSGARWVKWGVKKG
jgi:hypothetical protein